MKLYKTSMNLKKNHILRGLWAALALIPAAGITSSCGMINEDLPECNQGARLRFIYDYNMEYANAFPSQVDCLTLLVYDNEGNFVASRTASAPEISAEDYRMTIDLPAGEYTFVAYGGMDCQESSFHFTDASTKADIPSKLENLEVQMNASSITAPEGKPLHKLFYGRLNLAIEEDALNYTDATVEMMRDTNEVRIILQQVNGEPVEDKDFVYTIEADNTLLIYKNDLVPAGSTTFYPYDRGEINVGLNQQGDESTVAFAQFGLSRFIENDKTTLTIKTAKEGRTVMSIPLTRYLLAFRNQYQEQMRPQEYLDRENTWNMIFFLDSDNRWVQVSIIIHDYVVRINDIEF